MGKSKNALYLASIGHSLSKSETTRFTMIQAAIKGIADDGLEGSNFERIARQLKTRRSHVAYYFKNRDELVLAAINYIVTMAQDLTARKVREASSLKEKILAINAATFEWGEKSKDHARTLVIFYSHCASNINFKKFNSNLRKEGTQRVLSIFKDYQLTGSDDELLKKAQTIQSIITGFFVENMSNSSISDC